jgi:Raf kinase inhibitor-like YbhB/YbcL family protein
MFDPDAPVVSGFWHWSVADIPASVTELVAGAGDDSGNLLPEGAIQFRNDAGLARFLGAGPPPGQRHRYFIVVHALDVERLDVDPGSTPAILTFTMLGSTVARAKLVAHAETPGPPSDGGP